MSLKNRLLNKKTEKKSQSLPSETKKEQEVVQQVVVSSSIDLLKYFDSNPDISAILVYGFNSIFVEKNGVLVDSEFTLTDNQALLDTIKNVANQYDKIINAQNPSFNIVLSNGVRINAIIPPMAKDGAYLSIRRSSRAQTFVSHELEDKVLSNEMLLFLKECLIKNVNIFVASDARVDKLNILNIIANKISDGDNIVTVESIPRLKIKSDRVLNLISSQSMFVKTMKKALGLKQDRIVLSNFPTSDMLSLFCAINSGYNGFLTSFDIKNYEDFLLTLKNLILYENSAFSEQNVQNFINSSLDIVVFVEKCSDMVCRITKISEIVKAKDNSELKEIFVWKENKLKSGKISGNHISTGAKSRFFTVEEFVYSGFLESYFDKGYKHNYIGKDSAKKTNSIPEKKQTKKVQSKHNVEKLKALKEKMKTSSQAAD